MMRFQLAAYSPVGPGSIAAGLLAGKGAIDRLQAVIRADYEADHSILVDSGTHALQLALMSLAHRLGNDPLVALPAFSCFDLATAVVGAGARVVFYDLDPRTLGPDATSLAGALANGARIVVIAPLYGVPVDWGEVESLASSAGAVLIEDAAQGHGASWQGRPLGSLAGTSTVSFSRGKGWTGGNGGAVLLRGPRLAEPFSATEAHPGTRVRGVIGLAAQWALGRPNLYGLPRSIPGLGLGETRYHDPTPVRGMTESAAAALLFNREASAREAQVRREVAAWFGERLDGPRVRRVAPPAGSKPGFLRFPVLIPGGVGGLRRASEAMRLGIAPSYPLALAGLPALSRHLIRRGKNPGADELAVDLITLPTHSLVSEAERDRIVSIVIEA